MRFYEFNPSIREGFFDTIKNMFSGGSSEPLTNLTVPTSTRGPEVADLQKVLVALGFPLPRFGIDGIRANETNGAISQFQRSAGLPASGEPDAATIDKLNAVLKSKPDIASKLTKSTEADVKSAQAVSFTGKGDASRGIGLSNSARHAIEFFMSKGWTLEQAAGIVGNLQTESGGGLNVNAVGDGGRAYGIAQWHPDRQAQFARRIGKNIRQSNLDDQLAFVQWELENSESRAGNALKSARSTEQAALTFDKYYERSAGLHGAHRVNNALALVNALSKTNTSNIA